MLQRDEARAVYVTGLKNAHAMEKQALSIMQPQLNRLKHYPELAHRLETHITETEDQVRRLDEALDTVGAESSAFKDAVLSALGTAASLGHVVAGDEVLKNSLANLAFENYEIAAYVALITAGEAAGEQGALPLLRQSLEEEEAMARWVREHLAAITTTFITLRSEGETAKR